METLAFIAACFALVVCWPHIFPNRCKHGTLFRPSKKTVCEACERTKAEEQAQWKRRLENQVRIEEQERVRIDELRRKETEKIRRLTYLQQMDPIEFEHLIACAFRNLGWEVEETATSGDRGVDAFLRRSGRLVILQCKRFSKARVGTPVLRDLLGTIVAERADAGIVATTSEFSADAIRWAKQAEKIQLMDGSGVLAMIAEAYPLGSPVPEEFVTRRKHSKIVPRQCPWCGGRTKRRKGRYGPFYGCTAFPRCKWTMPVPGKEYRTVRR